MSYARRERRLTAKSHSGLVVATIDVTVDVRERMLTRDEHDRIVEDLTSQVMAILPNIRYLHTPLSKVKVTR